MDRPSRLADDVPAPSVGSLYVWGKDTGGNLGTVPLDRDKECPLPTRVPQLEGVQSVACGESATAAITASDGVLWSDEMRAAADAADESGARIVCLGIDAPTAASSPPPPAVPMLGMVACWLRAHALRPALLDERGCDADDIAAMNTAMRETLPALHARKLVDVDDRIAQKLLTLCAQMGNDDAGVDAKRSIIPRAVVVVVGAQHVPGLEARLKTSRK